MTGLRFLSCVFFLATSSATATVITEGEVIFDGDNVIVGQETSGALTVTPPDVLALDSLAIARNSGVLGTVLIDGARITTQNGLSVGSGGIGTLTVQNGGQLIQNRGGTTIGSDGIGRLEVLGTGSMADLAAGSFLAGGSGPFFSNSLAFSDSLGRSSSFARGEILVSQGGKLLTGLAIFGAQGLTEATVEGNGSLWRGQDEMTFGNAELTLRDGGRLIHSNPSPHSPIQFGALGGTSSVLISGAGSLLSTNQEILIGESGQAIVRVEGGADVMADSTTLGDSRSSRFDGPQRGILELDGFGTTWTTKELNFSGPRGEGHAEIRITDGAVLNLVGSDLVVLGGANDSSAIVTIDGPHSRWNIPGLSYLYILGGGYGELRITGGAYHENDFVEIGTGAQNDDSKIVVSGAGSHWELRENLTLYRGEILVADGASMQIPRNFSIFAGGSLRLDGGELLRNSSNFSMDNRGQIAGDGTIEADINSSSTGSIYVGSGQRIEMSNLVNEGLVDIDGGELRLERGMSNAGQMNLYGATFRSDGAQYSYLSNEPGGEIRFLSGDNRVHGGLSNYGRLVVRGNSTVTFFAGAANLDFFSVSEGSTVFFLDDFFGFGGISGDGHVVFEGETLFGSDTTLGTDVTFTSTASLRIGIGGSSHVAFTSAGNVNLGGELELGVGVLPEPGLHELTLIEAALVEDTFDFLPEIDSLIGHRTLFRGIEYTDTTVTLLVELLAEGDFNGDGLVDAADYDAWVSAFGSTGDSWADGNGDGIVNAADYTLWRDAMDGELPASVPEPTSLALCLLLGLALQGRRFRL